MNKVFKVIWNATSQSWVAVSELGKAKTKTKSVSLAVAGALAIAAGAVNAQNVVQGDGAQALAGTDSVVLGDGATANQGSSVAVGSGAKTGLNGAIAVGKDANAVSYGDIAIGHQAHAHTQDEAGTQQITERQSSIAIGSYAKADRYNGVAIGNYANATRVGGAAFGNNATANGEKSTALGEAAKTSDTGALAAGANAVASAQASTALGDHANASKYVATAVGWASLASGKQATAVGAQASAETFFATAVGTGSNATGFHSTALGAESKANGPQSTAVGNGAVATNQGTVAVGHQAQANGDKSVAIGRNSIVNGDNSVAIGQNNTVTAQDAFVLGSNITDPHSNSVILGANSAAVGYTAAPDTDVKNEDGSTAYTYDATKYAGHLANTPANQGYYLSIGSEGKERQIKNLAAGTISDKSTDAVNGSQLYAVMDRLETIAKTGFNIGENNTAGDVNQEGDGPNNATSVGLSNNIDFNNGHLTVARVEVVPNANNEKQRDAKVYYDVVTQALATTSTNGKAAVGTEPAQSNGAPVNSGTAEAPVTVANPNALTTAQNVADAINASGWVTTNTNGSTSVVNPGDKVNFANGTGTVADVVTVGDTTTVKYNVAVDSETVKLEGGKVQAVTSPITQSGAPAAGDQKSATNTPNALATAGDVVDAVNSARETVTSNDKSITVKPSANSLGGTNYDLSVVTQVLEASNDTDGKVTLVAPTTGTTTTPANPNDPTATTPAQANPNALVTAGTVQNAINGAGWLTSFTVTEKDANGKDVLDENGNVVVKKDAQGNNITETVLVNPGDNVNYVDGNGTRAVVTPSKDANGKDTVNVAYDAKIDGVSILINEYGQLSAVGTVADRYGKGPAGVNGKDGETITRIVYQKLDENGNILKGADGKDLEPEQVATLNDGLKFQGNTPAVDANGNPILDENGNPVPAVIATKLNEALQIVGGLDSKAPASDRNTRVDVVDGKLVVKISEQPQFGGQGANGQDGVDGKVVVADKAGNKGVEISAADGVGVIGLNGKDGANAAISVEKGVDTANAENPNLSEKGANGVDGTNGAGGNGKTRVTYTDPTTGVKEQIATMNDGLVFGGDVGTDSPVKLNNKVTVKGGQTDTAKLSDKPNVGVVSDGKGNLEVKLAKDVDLGEDSSVKAGTVTVAGKDGANVALTSNKGQSFNTAGKADGGSVDVLNVGTAGKPTRVTNVANGEISATSKDAINGSQLHAVANNINNRIDGVDKRVGKLDKRVRGVGANAAAAAALPQVYVPGKSMVAASAGGYGGASALAVGYSRASDNGRTILKLQGTVNSQGHVSGGVGVGFQW